MNRRGVQRGYNNSYYPNDPAPYYYEEDDPNDDEEHARQYTLELDWLASVREGEKVDLKTQEYQWTLARVVDFEWGGHTYGVEVQATGKRNLYASQITFG